MGVRPCFCNTRWPCLAPNSRPDVFILMAVLYNMSRIVSAVPRAPHLLFLRFGASKGSDQRRHACTALVQPGATSILLLVSSFLLCSCPCASASKLWHNVARHKRHIF